MNIYDVAAKAGVSTATVSRVLNHSPHVSRQTSDRVMQVMHAMGYAPNVFARGLAGSSTKVLGVLCVGISDVYFASALRAIEKNARAIGYDVTLLCDGVDSAHLREHITQMSERRVDGLILVGSVWTQEAGEEFLTVIGKRVPVMVLGGRISAKKVYSVSCDDREGVSSAVSYLSRAGRGRLVYVYDTDTPSGRDKLAGFRAACQSAGLVPHTLKSDRGVRGGVRIAGSILKSGENFDAVVCADDLIAAGILQDFAAERSMCQGLSP